MTDSLPRCPTCRGVCRWVDTAWVCDDCGDEFETLEPTEADSDPWDDPAETCERPMYGGTEVCENPRPCPLHDPSMEES